MGDIRVLTIFLHDCIVSSAKDLRCESLFCEKIISIAGVQLNSDKSALCLLMAFPSGPQASEKNYKCMYYFATACRGN